MNKMYYVNGYVDIYEDNVNKIKRIIEPYIFASEELAYQYADKLNEIKNEGHSKHNGCNIHYGVSQMEIINNVDVLNNIIGIMEENTL